MNDIDSDPRVDEENRLSLAAQHSLTDQMIERLAITGGNALELLDRLYDETTRDACIAWLAALAKWRRSARWIRHSM